MKNLAIAMFALFAVAFPVFAQGSLLDRAARLEQQTKFILENMASKADVKAIKDDLAVIKAALQKASSGTIVANVDPFAASKQAKQEYAHVCTCGCVETGKCACPNCAVGCGLLPNTPAQAKTVSPRYKTVCNGNSCSKVLMTADECYAADNPTAPTAQYFDASSADDASAGGGRTVGPIRRFLQRIFSRRRGGASIGCASCGG